MSDRAFNGRVLLEHAAGELRADLRPDPYEIGLAVGAAAEVLELLDKASRIFGVDPPGAGQPSPVGAHPDRARHPSCAGSAVAPVVSEWRVELGAAIRQARMAARLSQEELAGALGVRQSSVSQWEQGRTAPATCHLLGLLRVLGALLARLLLGENATVQGGAGELLVFCRSCAATAATGEGPLALPTGQQASSGCGERP
jgi:transcriptional regulator with XRE-family HTH domain